MQTKVSLCQPTEIIFLSRLKRTQAGHVHNQMVFGSFPVACQFCFVFMMFYRGGEGVKLNFQLQAIFYISIIMLSLMLDCQPQL